VLILKRRFPNGSKLKSVYATNPLVTVIIPFYNEERFLEETIQSVLPQTYTRWEMMLIDDGSSDGSTAIAKKYAAPLTRIRSFI
jgi:glycosyltransferase involved in cell wall biosynthesis